ncbi:NAD(+) diphosphatase [Granulicoccus sp. GXG6511]|uniref:NAD(+) diphosphatase n=1 Tax=Granulicoccus sp. GXG6511 TaxID=3381351 RepID=UPI003D7D8E3F
MHAWMSEASLDRADNRRKVPEWVSAQWRRPGARLLLVDSDGQVATDETGSGPAGVPTSGNYNAQLHTFLGLVDGIPWFTTEGPIIGPSASLRHLGAVTGGAALELTVGAVALTAWHRLEPHCSGCGARTRATAGGLTRRCPVCGRVQFPRTDPAVIVAVIDPDDRILLGRQSSWDPGRMSVLAGFVDAGESLEQAVHREVFEESGVRLREVRYFGSQPWPFPRSLMVGFVADSVSAELTIDRDEIEEAAWFTRADLAADLAEGRVIMPGKASIAHRLITAWQGRLLG